MATVIIPGRLLVETAGPTWLLHGTLKRVGPNQVTLTRISDALSRKIQAAVGKFVPAVHVTETVAHTVALTNASIVSYQTYHGARPPTSGGAKGVDTNEQEQINFTFQEITYTNVSGGISGSDDWLSWPP